MTMIGTTAKEAKEPSTQRDMKVTIIGAKDVGKTCLFNRYVYDEFGKTSQTVGAYFGWMKTKVDNVAVDLALWDSAGHEKFAELMALYCRNANFLIYVFDGGQLSDKQIDQQIAHALNVIEGNLPEASKNAPVHFVINKIDLVEEAKETKDAEQLKKFKTAIQEKMSAKLSELADRH